MTDDIHETGETGEQATAAAATDPTGSDAGAVTAVADPVPVRPGAVPSKRPLVLGGALLVVVALVGGWFLLGGGGDDGDDEVGGSAAELPGTLYDRTFSVVGITEGGKPRPVVAVSPGVAPTFRLTEADGVAVTGCNGVGGAVTFEGDRLTVAGEWASTTMACVGGPVDGDPASGQGLMDQDAWFGTFFGAGPRVALDGKQLTLTTADAEVQLVEVEPAGDAELWGNRWELTSISEGETATSVPSTGGSAPLLDTATEGQVGFTGCNSGSAAATIDGDRLVVEPLGMTEMACTDEGGQELMDLDATMATFLTAEPTISIEGDVLTLATETTTVTFRRVGAGDGSSAAPSGPEGDAPPSDPGSGSAPTVSTPEGDDGPAGGTGGGGSPGSPGADGIFGHRWTITQVCPTAEGDGGCAAPVVAEDGGAPVLDLSRDGVLAFTGCNGGGADVELSTDDSSRPHLAVGPILGTKKACADQALMDQDRAFGAFFEAGPVVELAGDDLRLTSGGTVLVLTRSNG